MSIGPSKFVFAVSAAALAVLPVANSATAQPYEPPYGEPPPPPPNYQQQGDPNYQQGDPNYQGYNQAPPQYQGDPNYQAYDQGPPPPPNYDGRQLPPPPPGYNGPQYERAWSQQDEGYAQAAEDWARRYCVKSQSNVGAGAAIGGILGAIIGSGLGGRHDRGGGMIIGGVVGAAGGAAIASASDGATSPGCPPGYVVRRDAVTFSYAPAGYYYAAPGWYRPWVFVDNSWVYRPYPYHVYYYNHYRGPWRHGPYRHWRHHW